MIVKDDYESIEVVLGIDNPVDRFDTNGIVSAVELLYKQSLPSDPSEISLSPAVGCLMSEVASEALMLGSIK